MTPEEIIVISKGMRGYYQFTSESTYKRYKYSHELKNDENEKEVIGGLLNRGCKDIHCFYSRTAVKGYYVTMIHYN